MADAAAEVERPVAKASAQALWMTASKPTAMAQLKNAVIATRVSRYCRRHLELKYLTPCGR
jgi:hypothetical protein